MCRLGGCATNEDHAPLMILALIAAFLLSLVFVWCTNRLCHRRRNIGRDTHRQPRSRDRDIVAANEDRPTSDDDEDINVSVRLNEMRRMQILRGSLITTRVIAATTTSVVFVDLSKKDPLEATEHTKSTDTEESSSTCSSIFSNTDPEESGDNDDKPERRERAEDAVVESTDMSSIDEEEGLQHNIGSSSLSLADDGITDSCLVLESTGRVIDDTRCAICIEPYRRNDLVSYSRMENKCAHVFHKRCIELWLVDRDDCPCCRYPYA
mmetsp:Transcript_23899/g.57631  ORF Transcript_23899/g.57631 Transcript_23899/m.57631 type:complete len:266 (+) Transcript_23899:121-918(+)